MAKCDTKTNNFLDIAANGTREDLPTSTSGNTRTQNLILEVADRIMDVEDEVEELKNNPDVVDLVATYADLQAYNTTHLNNNDVIRVLADETHDGKSSYYRWNSPQPGWNWVASIDSVAGAITGTGAPTSSTEASDLGQTYLDLDSGVLYYCSDISDGVYTWREVATVATPSTDWGTIEYYTGYYKEFLVQNTNNATINNFDTEVYAGFAEEHGLYDDSTFFTATRDDEDPSGFRWDVNTPEGEVVSISGGDFTSTTGIDATIDDITLDFAEVQIEYHRYVDLWGGTSTVQLSSQEEYDSLGSQEDMRGPFGAVGMLWKNQIKAYTFPNRWVGYTPAYFMNECENLTTIDTEYEIVESTGASGDYIPVSNFGADFLNGCSSFNSDLIVGPEHYQEGKGCVPYDITIGDYFLMNCSAFDSNFGGMYHWQYCTPRMNEVPNYFMAGTSSFSDNGVVSLKSFFQECGVKKIGNYFLLNSGVKTIPVSDEVEEIGDHFMTGALASVATTSVTFPSLKKVGSYFFSQIGSSTQVTITANMLEVVGIGFLQGARAKNIILNVPNLSVVGNDFLAHSSLCTSLRVNAPTGQDIVYLPKLEAVPNNFLRYDTVLLVDKVLLPSAISVGDYFLSGCSAMNAEIKLDSVEKIEAGFLGSCNALVSPIYLGNIVASNITSSNNSFSVTDSAAVAYTTGMTIVAEDVVNILARFPDQAVSPYRKLINGGTGTPEPTPVVQTTGTSTTDVMSQNAVTSMVFADPSTKYKVQVGASGDVSGGTNQVAIGRQAMASSSYNGITIGPFSSVSGNGGIALGSHAQSVGDGVMNIGSTLTTYGYNSSNYRLLTGLYDPQNNHDAANKQYCDSHFASTITNSEFDAIFA